MKTFRRLDSLYLSAPTLEVLAIQLSDGVVNDVRCGALVTVQPLARRMPDSVMSFSRVSHVDRLTNLK